MKWFVDSGNLSEIKAALKRGASGVTTNPSILARDGTSIEDVMAAVPEHISVSIELTTSDPEGMARQAQTLLARYGQRSGFYIKVPIGWDELEVIRTIRAGRQKVNCTAIMTYGQAIMAVNAGANYVSLFWNRIKDSGASPFETVYRVHETLVERHSDTEIIVGSIRLADDVSQAWQAGADIVTIPPVFMSELCTHPQTDKVVAEFLAAAAKLEQ